MKNIHKFFPDNVESINYCGRKVTLVAGSNFIKPYPIEHYPSPEHNLDNCKGCKSQYEGLLKHINDYFKKFPNCCLAHEKLLKTDWFFKQDFNDLPKMVADKTIFSFHHVLNKLEDDNWKEDIINYLEYAFDSFGEFPDGYGNPAGIVNFLDTLKQLLSNYSLVGEGLKYNNRKEYIIKYIDSMYHPPQVTLKDVKHLIECYDNWFEVFPFDLEYFKHLKSEYANKFPFIMDNKKVNPYSGKENVSFRTLENMISYLNTTTIKILGNINTQDLLLNGEIKFSDKLKLDLIKKNHQFGQNLLLEKFNKNQITYIKTLKNWLNNEKLLILEIEPYLKKASMGNKIDYTFEELFSRKEQEYILKLLRDFKITNENNIYHLTKKKIGSILGVVEALRENYVISNNSLHNTCTSISDKINAGIQSKLECSITSGKYKKLAQRYILDNPISTK